MKDRSKRPTEPVLPIDSFSEKSSNAVSSEPTAAESRENIPKLKRSDPRRANHLKAYRWQKGQPSPNPSGRPALPLTYRLKNILEMTLPFALRSRLEDAIDQRLPKNLKIADGLEFARVLAAMGSLDGFRQDIARDIRESV